MLRSLKSHEGNTVQATDGSIGKVGDFLFDDAAWVIRYIVTDVGDWLKRRHVLVSPVVVRNTIEKTLPVEMTRKQVEESPDITAHKPVSREREEILQQYWGWPAYWGALPGVAVPPVPPDYTIQKAASEQNQEQTGNQEAKPYSLRSAREVKGYRMHATDHNIGHCSDLIVDTANWSIRYIVVDTGSILSGHKVLLAPYWIREIDWAGAAFVVDMESTKIKDAPKYDPNKPVNRELEEVLFDYYGRPKYWVE